MLWWSVLCCGGLSYVRGGQSYVVGGLSYVRGDVPNAIVVSEGAA